MFVTALLGKAVPDSVDHLWNLCHWDSVEHNKLNNKVADPIFDPAVRAFNPLDLSALEVLPGSLNCFLNHERTCFLSPIAPRLELMKVSMERQNLIS